MFQIIYFNLLFIAILWMKWCSWLWSIFDFKSFLPSHTCIYLLLNLSFKILHIQFKQIAQSSIKIFNLIIMLAQFKGAIFIAISLNLKICKVRLYYAWFEISWWKYHFWYFMLGHKTKGSSLIVVAVINNSYNPLKSYNYVTIKRIEFVILTLQFLAKICMNIFFDKNY